MQKAFCLFLLLAISGIYGQTMSVEKAKVSKVLDEWHDAAARANYEVYFDLMTDDGVFLGTDATENWQNEAFRTFAKPYFDRGKAWNFTPVERNIYINGENFAWFDELLDTQMGLCRGSGVLIGNKGNWKIAHYVLSIAVPNDNVDELLVLKKENDSLLTKKLKSHYRLGKER